MWKVTVWVFVAIYIIMLLRHELYFSAHSSAYLCDWELTDKTGLFHNRGRIWQRGLMGCCTELHKLQNYRNFIIPPLGYGVGIGITGRGKYIQCLESKWADLKGFCCCEVGNEWQ